MTTLILSGWTQPSNALAAIEPGAATFDYSDYPSPEASFPALAQFRDVAHVVAWSLGGQLVLHAIAAGILAPQHLTLIATPYQFVSDAAVKAMDPVTFAQFRENYAQNPARSKGRFHGLVAKGDRDFGRVLADLTHHGDVENTARWLPWLDALGRHSLAETALPPMPPTFIVHGENDAIVPAAQAALLAEKLGAQASLWPDAAHAPHLHDAARLRAEIAAHRRAHGVAV